MSTIFLARGERIVALVLALSALAGPAAAFDVLSGSSSSSRISHLDGATGELEGLVFPPCNLGLVDSRGPRLGPDGLIYVGTAGAVYRIDSATGTFVDVFISGLSGTAFFTVHAPDGTVWGTLGGSNLLFHASAGGSLLGLVSTPNPIGIAVGADGHLYVANSVTGVVTRFNSATGALIGVFGDAPSGIAGLSFGPDGDLYASLLTLNDIGRFDGATGAYEGSFIQPGHPHPSDPRGPSWGPDGNLYASSNATGEILRYDASGAYLGVYASGLQSPGAAGFVPDLSSTFGTTGAVDTTSGPVAGFLQCGVRGYQGIPYAEAPTGSQRWKRPTRKAASPTPIRALAHGPACIQSEGVSVIGSEDCLKLSIWRPDAPPATPLPVLFFIHGGGLWGGSISSSITDGAGFALAQNAIVVEAQYRVGALGFLGLPQLAAEDANGSTGNYGFLDQLEALRWVHDNIAAFGGDPNQVTIAGSSAGGWSVCALMASPLSDGLFRAGIVQSGQCGNARPLTLPNGSPVLNDPLFGDTIYERGDRIVTNAGCGTAPDKLDCLRALPASSLVQAHSALPRGVNQVDQPVNPALDGYVLAEQPVVLLRQGAADGRALMIGTTANESTYFSEFWDSMTSEQYEAALRTAAGNTRADALLPLYPAASYTPVANAFRTLIDDTTFVCPTLDTADAAAAGGSPAWVYHLTFPPTYGPPPNQAWRRTFHSLDLYYAFGSQARLGGDYGIIVTANDNALSASIQNAWGSFVRTGVPTTTPAWPLYAPTTPGDLASVSVLQFDVPNTLVSGTAFRSGRCAVFFPVANQLDPDRDIALPTDDNCPTLANTNQADTEADAVGNVCDNCVNVANARVAADFLTANPWATLTGGQRDDDHDGYGNKCDAKFVGLPSANVGGLDLAQFRASNAEDRRFDTCGTTNTRPCAIFDLDEAAAGHSVGGLDLGRFRQLNAATPGPRCSACPLPCTAGTSGSCD